MGTLTTAGLVVVTLLRGLILLAAAAAMAVLLRRAPARRRATLWSLALVGTLLIPIASRLLPEWRVPAVSSAWQTMCRLYPADPTPAPPMPRHRLNAGGLPESFPAPPRTAVDLPYNPAGKQPIPWNRILLWSWAGLAGALIIWQCAGLLRLRALHRVPLATIDPSMQAIVERAKRQVPVRRSVTVALSDEVAIPVTWGLWRPIILLPPSARAWLPEKLHVVLLHELVHIREMHWPLRLLARTACAVYWCNPLTWWARNRLILDQELACDEEVLRLGSTPSTYASHLLEVARATPPRILAAGAALELTRRQHLEGRIMAILDTKKKLGLAATIPIILLMVSLVPAIAAVQPWSADSAATTASNEQDLKTVLKELRRTEEEMQPILERFENVEADMQPYFDALEDLEVDMEPIHAELETALEPLATELEGIEERMEPLHLELEQIESKLQPYLEQIEIVQQEMQPILAELQSLDIDIDLRNGEDSDFVATMRELEDRLQPLQERLAQIEVDMTPVHELMGEVHEQIEPYHRELERLHEIAMEKHGAELDRLHEQLQPSLAEIEKVHASMKTEHLRLAELEKEMEPFHERLATLGRRLENGLRRELEQLLRSHLEAVTEDGAPFTEAAERIVDGEPIHVDDDVFHLEVDETDLRQMLDDLFTPYARSGAAIDFPNAMTRAVDAVVNFQLDVN